MRLCLYILLSKDTFPNASVYISQMFKFLCSFLEAFYWKSFGALLKKYVSKTFLHRQKQGVEMKCAPVLFIYQVFLTLYAMNFLLESVVDKTNSIKTWKKT